MWYTVAMRTRVRCNCGWQRELSEFYSGKRIRCPECAAIVEVPGEDSRGAYLYPPMIDWPSGRHVKPQGKWVAIPCAWNSPSGLQTIQREQETRRRQCCSRGRRALVSLVTVPLAIVLAMIVLSPANRQATKPQTKTEPTILHVEVDNQVQAPRTEPESTAKPQEVPQPERLEPPVKPEPRGHADPDGEREDEF